jgi:hypothetical protein
VPTQHQFRLLLIVPEARRAAFNAWVKANLDPAGGDWVRSTLSATGSAPATHGWCSAAMTAAEFKAAVQRLCALASITPDPAWDSMTRSQKRDWLVGQRQAIDAATGIYLQAVDNDGSWGDAQAALKAKGLKPIPG